jgi:hypothetical protein
MQVLGVTETNMKPETEKNLWEELKLLQGIVNKFDDFSFRIKNWFFTVFAAITGYAVVQQKPSLVLLSFGVIAMFYLFELTYRATHSDFLSRLREVQELLRHGGEPNQECMPPFMDKFVLLDSETDVGGVLYTLQKRVGVPEARARRNLREWRKIFGEAMRVLFQLRVSLPYLAAAGVGLLALLLAN